MIVVLSLLLLLVLLSVLVSGRSTDTRDDRRAGARPDQTWHQPLGVR